MYILNMCEEPSILNLILFVKGLIEILGIVVPIILIIMVSIELVKIVFDVSDKTVKASTKSILNKIIATIVVFFVPTIVNLILSNLNQMNVQQTECWVNANTDTISYYKDIKEARELSERQQKQAKIAENNKAREKAEEERKNNIVKKSAAGQRLADVALKEVGNSGDKYKKFFGFDGDWCAMFVFWSLAHTPVNNNKSACQNVTSNGSNQCVYNGTVDVKSGLVNDYIEQFNAKYKFYHSKYYANKFRTYKKGSKAYEPQPGDLIYFSWTGGWRGNPASTSGGQVSHIGIVTEVKGNNVYTVEGNTGSNNHYSSKVLKKSYDINSSEIVGYGVWTEK